MGFPNVEVSCTIVLEFLCFDKKLKNTITSSIHYFYTNYDFLLKMKERYKDVRFIPLSFATSFYRDYLNDWTSDFGHYAFLFVGTKKYYVAYFDPNYDDKIHHIYNHDMY